MDHKDYPSKQHHGKDYKANNNANVYASASGRVLYIRKATSPHHGMGNTVIVEHKLFGEEHSYILTQYSHLNSINNLEIGDLVSKGSKIGIEGNTGTGVVHLHFEVKNSFNHESDGYFGPVVQNSYLQAMANTIADHNGNHNYFGYSPRFIGGKTIDLENLGFYNPDEIICSSNNDPLECIDNIMAYYHINASIANTNLSLNGDQKFTVYFDTNYKGNHSQIGGPWNGYIYLELYDINGYVRDIDFIEANSWIGSVSYLENFQFSTEGLQVTNYTIKLTYSNRIIENDYEDRFLIAESQINTNNPLPNILPKVGGYTINLSVNQKSYSATQGGSFEITGKAVYDGADAQTGKPIVNGTVVVTTSESSWTGPVNDDGSFSISINAPSMSGVIRIEVYDGNTVDTEQRNITVNQGNDPNSFDIVELESCFSFNSNLGCIYGTTSHFKVWNGRAYFRIDLASLDRPTQVRFKFYRPNGSYLWTYDSDYSPVGNPDWYFFTYLDIAEEAISDHQGLWKVEIYTREQGGTWEYYKNHNFVLSHILKEHKTCRSIINDQANNPASIFYSSDDRVYSWAHFSDQCNELELKAEWYEPNGGLYKNVSFTLSSPGNSHNDWVPERYQWMYIDIKNNPAECKTGEWEIKYYSKDPFGNWDLEYTDNFWLEEAPEIAPSVSSTSSKSIFDINEEVILSVSAHDNAYLRQIVLYYHIDEGWRSKTWDNINAKSKDINYNIGSLVCDQTVPFYAVAIDNSGNSTFSEFGNIYGINCCANDLTIISTTDPLYESSQTITTSGNVDINSGQTSQFRSQAVTLKPGFHTKSGSVFRANVDPCNN